MLGEEVKRLEEKLKDFNETIYRQSKEIERLKSAVKHYRDCCLMVLPEKVYVHKERRNTTVKFRDGSSMTVKRRQGEKDCIETAIAYCVLKQLLTAQDVRELVKGREEH